MVCFIFWDWCISRLVIVSDFLWHFFDDVIPFSGISLQSDVLGVEMDFSISVAAMISFEAVLGIIYSQFWFDIFRTHFNLNT